MKALSPGVNDTSTAVSCIDYLSVLLSKLATRRLEAPFLRESSEQRVLAEAPRFDEIRLSAGGNVTIILQMLCALRRVASVTKSSQRRRALLEHGRVIIDAADRTVVAGYDRARINRDVVEVREAFAVEASNLPVLAIVRPISAG